MLSSIMKRFIQSAVFSLASVVLLGGQVFGQEVKHPEKPLLWKIEGKGLEKPSYLFGTIHLGAEAVTTLHRVHDKKIMKLLSIGEPWIGGRR
jgi:uncharacterized protein YbaP (TraB family)